MSKNKLYAGLNPKDFCCGKVLQAKGCGVWFCSQCKTSYVFDYTGQRFPVIKKEKGAPQKTKLSPQEELLSVSV